MWVMVGFVLGLIPLKCSFTVSTDKVPIKHTALLIVGEMGHTCTLTLNTWTCMPSTQECKCDQVCVMGQPLTLSVPFAQCLHVPGGIARKLLMSTPTEQSKEKRRCFIFEQQHSSWLLKLKQPVVLRQSCLKAMCFVIVEIPVFASGIWWIWWARHSRWFLV